MGAKEVDLCLIVADKAKVVFDALGFLRRDIARKMGLLDDSKYNLLWVVDFPLYEYDEEEGTYSAMHQDVYKRQIVGCISSVMLCSPLYRDLCVLTSGKKYRGAKAKTAK